jgi:uncharacterized protein (TIGR02466 family)
MLFSSPVYIFYKQEFLNSVKKVSEENLKKISGRVDDIYPVEMTSNFFDDIRISEFVHFVGSTAWDILDDQGYDMKQYSVFFSEMWTQKHYKHSLMEPHIHGFGSQLVGFYFLEVPKKSSKLVFHDPRSGKVQNNLLEKDTNVASHGSIAINFNPEPGMLVLSNSWLPHSLSRHPSKEPIKFVHFNLMADLKPNFSNNNNYITSQAEVI